MFSNLPAEVLVQVMAYLSVGEIIHLSHASARIHRLIRKTVIDTCDYEGAIDRIGALDCIDVATINFRYRRASEMQLRVRQCITEHTHKITTPYVYTNKCVNLVLHTLDLSNARLNVDAMNVVIPSFVRRLILISIPRQISARFDELKIHMRNARYDVFLEWKAWVPCKKLIMVIQHDANDNAHLWNMVSMAQSLICMARKFVPDIVVIVEAELLPYEVADVVACLPGVGRIKFRRRYYYYALWKYAHLAPRVYIRRMCDCYELNVQRMVAKKVMGP